jgi:hypothetical protein
MRMQTEKGTNREKRRGGRKKRKEERKDVAYEKEDRMKEVKE